MLAALTGRKRGEPTKGMESDSCTDKTVKMTEPLQNDVCEPKENVPIPAESGNDHVNSSKEQDMPTQSSSMMTSFS